MSNTWGARSISPNKLEFKCSRVLLVTQTKSNQWILASWGCCSTRSLPYAKSGDVWSEPSNFEGSLFFAFKSKSDWNLFSVTRYLLANEDTHAQ